MVKSRIRVEEVAINLLWVWIAYAEVKTRLHLTSAVCPKPNRHRWTTIKDVSRLIEFNKKTQTGSQDRLIENCVVGSFRKKYIATKEQNNSSTYPRIKNLKIF